MSMSLHTDIQSYLDNSNAWTKEDGVYKMPDSNSDFFFIIRENKDSNWEMSLVDAEGNSVNDTQPIVLSSVQEIQAYGEDTLDGEDSSTDEAEEPSDVEASA